MFITKEQALSRLKHPNNTALFSKQPNFSDKAAPAPEQIEPQAPFPEPVQSAPQQDERTLEPYTPQPYAVPEEYNPDVRYARDISLEPLADKYTAPVVAINEPAFKSVMTTVAGSLALQGEPVQDVARHLGIPVEDIKKATKKSSPHREAIQQTLNRVNEVALDRLLLTLGLLTPDDIKYSDAVDKTKIAANLAKIVERTGEKDNSDKNASQINIVLYSPQTKLETQFKTVELHADEQ